LVTQSSLHAPDLSSRPHGCTVSHVFPIAPDVLYRAWTEQVDRWFAEPGSVLMTPAVDRPFFFETAFEGTRHPHYGRFLHLEPDRRIEMTWVTGVGGTGGAETIVSVDLEPAGNGTRLTLRHAGFADEVGMEHHRAAWPLVLEQMEQRLAAEKEGPRTS
jgi:uncharacterized protein YndB with AHSA1/START domain